MKVTETYTIEQFKSFYGNDKLNYENFCIKEKESEENFIAHNVIDDYLPELEKLVKVVEFSDEEYIKYIYKPKLLAYDIYGSTELFFIIMKLNGICSIRDFDMRKIKLLPLRPVNVLTTVLSAIYNNESNTLAKYN